jgi:hypothetical protein
VLLSAGLSPDFRITAPSVILAILTAAALVGGLGLMLLANQRRGDPPLMLAPVLWVVVPTLVAIIAAAGGEPLELDRSAVLLVPGVALVLTWVIWHSGALRAVAWTGLAVVVALRVIVLIPTYDNSPEPWQTVSTFVLDHAQRGDCIAFYPEDGRMAFGYYVRRDAGGIRRAPTPVLPVGGWHQLKPYVESYALPTRPTMDQWARQCTHLWVISSHAGSSTGTDLSRQNYAGLISLERGLDHRFAHFAAWHFGRAAVINVRVYTPTASKAQGRKP